MALPQKDEYYTLEDALNWEEHERIEILDGYPVMQAAPSRQHQEVAVELTRQLANYLVGTKCKVFVAPFTVCPFATREDDPRSIDTLVEPDITVVCDPEKLDKVGCKGAPDLIIEILSPSSLRHDRLTKHNLYQRAGVREYWIVDPESKTVQTFVLENGYYAAQDFGDEGDTIQVNVLEDCAIDLSLVFPE